MKGPFHAVYVAAAAGFVFVAYVLASALTQQPTEPPIPTPTVAPCRALPDPDDCVQLGWLDGAWRCIPTDQAG